MQLRAGECFADADGITNTNPVNKQSRYAELTSLGKRQIVNRIAPALEEVLSLDSTWIWPSINNASYETAEILTSVLALGQSRVIPEYSFLDPRGLGALDGRPYDEVQPLLREGDASSQRWRPPAGARCCTCAHYTMAYAQACAYVPADLLDLHDA